jgi:uncharacterized membrane protein
MDTNSNMPARSNKTVMAVFAYLGPLVIVSYLVEKSDTFVKYHIKQGLVLLAISIILWILSGAFMFGLYNLIRILNLCVLVLAIIGIVNAVQGKENPLPLVGQFADRFNI